MFHYVWKKSKNRVKYIIWSEKITYGGILMLINFRVENFLSISNLIEFSMVSGKTKRHMKNTIAFGDKSLLKFSAIYGANASGKSSFIKAISASRQLIVEGFDSIGVIQNSYNKNARENEDKETKFEYDIAIGDRIYTYGFSVILSKMEFINEWLYDMTHDETLVYNIDKYNKAINEEYLSLKESIYNRLEIYAEDNQSNRIQLFLSALNEGKKEFVLKDGRAIFSEIFDWFSNKLEVIGPDDITRDFNRDVSRKSNIYLKNLANYLRASGTGVTEVITVSTNSLVDIPPKLQDKIKQDMLEEESGKVVKRTGLLRTPKHIYILNAKNGNFSIEEVKFKHLSGATYNLYEESDGTVRLIELFSILFNKRDKVFVIDELDRSLHPLLTLNFVESFLDKKGKGQLVVTTHEDRLLDLDLIRRDEIWFVEKDSVGNSTLYSLEEYKERFDRNVMKAYLDGRYGAIPKLENLFSSLNSEVL
ncbi:AAA family ATPase [Lactococcus garvieae]|uniref:AAA family ATPase n=1 Tax=Lactococcus garvieae TaxID=1363 RepID=UPI0025505A7D|nr:ATP/GTP-binding protein [Lactococcus garvieae]